MVKKTKIKPKLSNVLFGAFSMAFLSDAYPKTSPTFNDIINKTEILEAILKERCPLYIVHGNDNKISFSSRDFTNKILSNGNTYKEYARKCGVSKIEAYADIQEYFKQKKLLVNPAGFAGLFNKISNFCVAGGCACQSYFTASPAQLSGLSGVSLITASPILVITVPTLFGLGFFCCECLTRGTILAPVCHIGARVCLLPLKISEIAVNNVILAIPNSLSWFEFPLIVNASDTILNGFGVEEKLAASLILKSKEIAGTVVKSGAKNFFKKWFSV